MANVSTKTRHVHAALIKQWADGATIQVLGEGEWWDCENNRPWWVDTEVYRVKPEPKPDIFVYGRVHITPDTVSCATLVDACSLRMAIDNVMFVFDGETGKLKAAQVLAHE